MPVYSFLPVLPSSDNGPARMVPAKKNLRKSLKQALSSAGPGLCEEKGETGLRVSSSWACSFHRSIPPKNSRATRQASWFPAPDHPLARTLPCHVTGKHVTGREPKTPKRQRSTTDAMERIRRQRERYNTIHEFLIHFCLTLHNRFSILG
jgi:hypothetical protein